MKIHFLFTSNRENHFYIRWNCCCPITRQSAPSNHQTGLTGHFIPRHGECPTRACNPESQPLHGRPQRLYRCLYPPPRQRPQPFGICKKVRHSRPGGVGSVCWARQIGNSSVLYIKAEYCFVFVNYNGKLRRRKRVFS